MNRLQITWIVSTDRDFDGIEGIERFNPTDVDTWRDIVFA